MWYINIRKWIGALHANERTGLQFANRLASSGDWYWASKPFHIQQINRIVF